MPNVSIIDVQSMDELLEKAGISCKICEKPITGNAGFEDYNETTQENSYICKRCYAPMEHIAQQVAFMERADQAKTGRVKAHLRRTKSGKVTSIKEHPLKKAKSSESINPDKRGSETPSKKPVAKKKVAAKKRSDPGDKLQSKKAPAKKSKGGKVIGYSPSSGNPIYDTHDHADHEDFSPADHRVAAQKHFEVLEGLHSQVARHGEHKKHESGKTLKEMIKHHEEQQVKHREKAHSMIAKSMDVTPLAKAEGSRGGQVIGHTKSGKPVYADHHHADHASFNSQDHYDAMEHHLAKRKDARAANQVNLSKMSQEEAEDPKSEKYKKSGELVEAARHHGEAAKWHDHQRMKKLDKSIEIISLEKTTRINSESLRRNPPKVAHVKGCSKSVSPESKCPRCRQKAALGLKKSVEIISLEKAGVGSRGGNVVGTTKSGKPIYQRRGTAKRWQQFMPGQRGNSEPGRAMDHAKQHGYSEQDHRDAAAHHLALAKKSKKLGSHVEARRRGEKLHPGTARAHLDDSGTHASIAKAHLNAALEARRSKMNKSEEAVGIITLDDANVLAKSRRKGIDPKVFRHGDLDGETLSIISKEGGGTIRGGGKTKGLPKGYVKGHFRKTKSGKAAFVKQHPVTHKQGVPAGIPRTDPPRSAMQRDKARFTAPHAKSGTFVPYESARMHEKAQGFHERKSAHHEMKRMDHEEQARKWDQQLEDALGGGVRSRRVIKSYKAKFKHHLEQAHMHDKLARRHYKLADKHGTKATRLYQRENKGKTIRHMTGDSPRQKRMNRLLGLGKSVAA